MTAETRNSASSPSAAPLGRVYLIGAGPGDPKLITVAGLEAIQRADVVVFDALANPSLLDHARRDAELIDAGKRAKHHKLSQEQINALLVEHAKAGRTVARLKGGDPYVFGRGSEEAIACHEHGVPAVIIPGLPAATAGLAYAGIPVTHRQVAVTCTFITGHEDPTKGESQLDLAPLAELGKRGGTLCFYMSMGRLPIITQKLIDHGLPADTPAACVQWATLPTQRKVIATLGTIADQVKQAELGAPAIVAIGPVVGVHDEALQWFERRPLFGQTVAVTRTRQHASDLAAKLSDLGAQVIQAPTIAIRPMPDREPAQTAIRQINQYNWLLLTSAHGVRELAALLDELNLDARHLSQIRFAVVGASTQQALRDELGIRADHVPQRFNSDALADELIAAGAVAGNRFLMLRADIAHQKLVDRLTEAGGEVEDIAVYQTVPPDALPEELIAALEAKRVDWLTFTSSSTVRNFLQLLGDRRDLLAPVRIASIGPITSSTARELGLTVHTEADRSDIDGLVAALVVAADR